MFGRDQELDSLRGRDYFGGEYSKRDRLCNLEVVERVAQATAYQKNGAIGKGST